MFSAFGDMDDCDDDKAGKVLAIRTHDNNKNNNKEAESPFLLHVNLPACIIITEGLPVFSCTGKKENGYMYYK